MLLNLTDRTLLLAGALLCALAAWCTIGYHHPDEHFQIWEFANYKLGNIPASDLPWEFPAQMRPGLQPFIAYYMVVAAKAIGVSNPFVQVFLMRLLCGAAAMFVYWKWSEWLERDLKHPNTVRWMRLGLLFFWLMPYLNVRFSSENTSAISFFGGLLLFAPTARISKKQVQLAIATSGIAFGTILLFSLSDCVCRPCLGAWLLFQKRPGLLS
jgi:phosphatidylinositol glycan class B